MRWRDVQFGPDGLAREAALGYSPAVRPRVDEQQSTTGFGIGGGRLGLGELLATGVGDLNAEDVADDVEGEPEVAAGDAAVVRRIVGQFGDEVACRVQGQPPGAELLGR